MLTRRLSLKSHLALGLAAVIALSWAVVARTSPARPAASPPALGTIYGRVTLDGGRPAVGFTVRAFPAVRPFFRFFKDNPNTATTDADGRYAIPLRPMNVGYISGPIVPNAKGYTVQVSNGGKPYVEPPARTADPEASPTHVVSGVDFVLRLGPQITVRARDAISGAPVAGLTVRCTDTVGRDQTSGVTGPDGVLRLRVPLTDFRLEAHAPATTEAAPGYGAGDRFSREVKAAPGQEVAWEIKTYGDRTADAHNSDWHGVVLGPDGKPAAGVSVAILRAGYQGGGTALVTDAQGRFSARLPRIAYGESPGWSDSTLPLAYAKQGALAAAQIITPDESWDGMTLRLAPGAILSGVFTDPQGRPAAHVAVTLGGWMLGGAPVPSFPAPTAVTDEAGRWTLDGLAPGKYEVSAHGGGFGNYAMPAASRSDVVQPFLRLAAGQRLYLGRRAVPHADRTLAGRVVDAHGAPVPSLYLSVKGAHTDQAASTQQDGTFRVYDVVAEPLTVTASAGALTVLGTARAGQGKVRLVAPADVVAANERGNHPAPPPARPTGPLLVFPQGASAPLNGLGLDVQRGAGDALTATIVRPNLADPLWPYRPPFADASGPVLWRGALADLDGIRLTVKHDRGGLTDRAGRALWSGVVCDPPDYTITANVRRDSTCAVTVRDGGGRTLWSGAADDFSGPASDGNIRVVGSGHTVAWERAVGNARVALHETGTGVPPQPDLTPKDGTITLHVATATATLRSSDGRRLWSGPTPVVTATLTGFPPPPSATMPDDHPSAPYFLWQYWRQWLLPPDALLLLCVQNPPHGATLSFKDAAGHPLPSATRTYP